MLKMFTETKKPKNKNKRHMEICHLIGIEKFRKTKCFMMYIEKCLM